jgi:hypothetical protein
MNSVKVTRSPVSAAMRTVVSGGSFGLFRFHNGPLKLHHLKNLIFPTSLLYHIRKKAHVIEIMTYACRSAWLVVLIEYANVTLGYLSRIVM